MIINGIVEPGKHLGRRLGFPTANVRPLKTHGAWPQNGVYAAALWLEGEDTAYLCMLNQGTHPTAPEGHSTIEAHVLNYAGDLYGRRVRVEYLAFLRPEHRFEDLQALAEQLNRDRAQVHQWLALALSGADTTPTAVRARGIRWAKV